MNFQKMHSSMIEKRAFVTGSPWALVIVNFLKNSNYKLISLLTRQFNKLDSQNSSNSS